jgi:hypothetical protein
MDARNIKGPAANPPTDPAAAVPAAVEDASGRSCLLVLPSDRPAARAEAAATEALLAELLRDPPAAARRACEWRAAALSDACGASLAALLAAVRTRPSAGLGEWRFKQAGKRSLTGAVWLRGN